MVFDAAAKMNSLKDAILRRKNRSDRYRNVFSSPDGRWVLEDILRGCFYHKPTFVANDIHQTILNEGSRRAALGILSQLSETTQHEIRNALANLPPSES